VKEWFFMVGDLQQVSLRAALGLIPAWNKPDDFRSDLCSYHGLRPSRGLGECGGHYKRRGVSSQDQDLPAECLRPNIAAKS